MTSYKAKILMTEFVTHNTKRFILEKPEGYEFTPGQATEVSINKEGWESEGRPFTFTSLNKDKVLEFTIKGYHDHEGVTKKMHELEVGDELLIGDAWGAIQYKGEGTFIAGGAGITPFISIFRDLYDKGQVGNNKLIFSNREWKDIILEREFKEILKTGNAIFTLTNEMRDGYKNRRIDKEFLKNYVRNFEQKFYVCGPPKMVEEISNTLKELGASVESIVFEG